MSRRIGETLVQAAKITEAQLHRALTVQLMYGGHLGTTLLELGYLDEESLGQTLSSLFGVPYADVSLLSRISRDTVRCLPERLVAKHSVVPLKVEGRTLHLAMIDPRNLIALDEIAFVTGYRLVPWVSPEVRILETLERHYGLQRSQRFVALAEDLSQLGSPSERLRTDEDDVEPLRPEPGRRTMGGNAKAAAGALETVVTHGGSPTASPSLPDQWEKYGYGRSWKDVAQSIDEEAAREAFQDEVETRPQPRAETQLWPGSTEPLGEPPSLTAASRLLAAAESVDEIVSTTLAYTSARLARCVFFVVKAGEAVGWSGRGHDVSDAIVSSLRVPLGLQHDTLFSLVGDDCDHFLGPVRQSRGIADFYAQLGAPAPRTVLIVPLEVKGRRSAFLYADGGDREILAIDLPSMLSLCARASLALQIIILRNKILAI